MRLRDKVAASWMTGQTVYLDGDTSLKRYPELFRLVGQGG